MRIDSPNVSNLTFQDGAAVADSQFTGSFTGSFTGVGNFTGLTADSVEYANILNKPTLVSGSAQVVALVEAGTDSNTFTDADHTKLNGIEASADVTDTDNVTAAGALMDSEVSNLADVKSFDPADYATAAQGTTADSAQQPPSEGAFVNGDKTKLDGIEASADVTDTANVKSSLNASLGGSATIGNSSDTITIPGNLTVTGTKTELQVTSLNVEDLNITVASGSADSAAADGAGLTVDGADATFTYSHSGTKWNVNKDLDLGSNNLITTGNVDGRDVSVDGAKLDGIETSADVTDTENVTAAGALMDSELTDLAGVKGVTISTLQVKPSEGAFANGDKTKLDNIEANADVTDTENVTAAGALMDSEVDADIKTLSLPANTTISEFARTLVDDANAATGRTTLELGTGNDVQFDSFGVGTAASGTTGEIRATGDITAFYSSDERLKENFAPLTGALDKVKAIGGYEFDWKDGIEEIVSKTGHDIGVKAQELQAQYPELVHERDNGYLAVDYIKLNAVLIEAVKELAAKVDELSK